MQYLEKDLYLSALSSILNEWDVLLSPTRSVLWQPVHHAPCILTFSKSHMANVKCSFHRWLDSPSKQASLFGFKIQIYFNSIFISPKTTSVNYAFDYFFHPEKNIINKNKVNSLLSKSLDLRNGCVRFWQFKEHRMQLNI